MYPFIEINRHVGFKYAISMFNKTKIFSLLTSRGPSTPWQSELEDHVNCCCFHVPLYSGGTSLLLITVCTYLTWCLVLSYRTTYYTAAISYIIAMLQCIRWLSVYSHRRALFALLWPTIACCSKPHFPAKDKILKSKMREFGIGLQSSHFIWYLCFVMSMYPFRQIIIYIYI